ncbi:MBL fold metallo-hydrolase [Oerskovia sp. M15]
MPQAVPRAGAGRVHARLVHGFRGQSRHREPSDAVSYRHSGHVPVSGVLFAKVVTVLPWTSSWSLPLCSVPTAPFSPLGSAARCPTAPRALRDRRRRAGSSGRRGARARARPGARAVLATHGHADHTWDAAELCERYDVPFWIHAGDAYRLADPLGTIEQELPLLPGGRRAPGPLATALAAAGADRGLPGAARRADVRR